MITGCYFRLVHFNNIRIAKISYIPNKSLGVSVNKICLAFQNKNKKLIQNFNKVT